MLHRYIDFYEVPIPTYTKWTLEWLWHSKLVEIYKKIEENRCSLTRIKKFTKHK